MFELTKKINSWYKYNNLGIIIVYGRSGLGKSSYAWKTIMQLYPQQEGETNEQWYDRLKRYIVFKPRELLDLGQELSKTGERLKSFIIDDAGIWFSKYSWRDPVALAAIEYLQVIRTRTASIIMTTPSPKLLMTTLLSLDLFCVKVTMDNENNRFAVGYDFSMAPHGKIYVNRRFEDRFNVILPTPFYNWYRDYRNSYTVHAEKKMQRAINYNGEAGENG